MIAPMRPPVHRAVHLLLACLIFSQSGCTRFDALNATIPFWGYSRTKDLKYGDLPRQKLDVYRPHGTGSAIPVVIFFYGGDWQTGNKSDYRFVADALTSRGLITVLPDYRLYPEVTFPAFVEDAAKAVRWTHENISKFGGDPRRIYLMGHSAGAHIAALLTLDAHYLKNVGLDRSAIRATAALSGPYDFVPATYDRPPFGMSPDNTTPDPRIEPIHFVDGREPPMLLLHGLKDQTVNPDNSAKLAARITAAGGEVRYISYPKADHVAVVLALAFPFRWLAPVLDDVTTFFHQH
jgi:acetyl esterase/lipase